MTDQSSYHYAVIARALKVIDAAGPALSLEELAARMDIQEMTKFIIADSLAFVSIDGLYRAVGEAERNKACPQYCDACFSGEYPTRLTDLVGRDGAGG